ncbi:hypothetical protein ACFLT5_01420 [Chloroflexota bacterium]
MRAAWRWMLVCGGLLASLAWPGAAEAHVGAPYPVLLEEATGPYVVSAIADPDVGTGTFYVLVTMEGGQAPPPDTLVTVWVEPGDGHQTWMGHDAVREQTQYGERFVAEVAFDVEGTWHVRLAIDGSAGSGETSFPVKVTPSGIGWLATLACLVPFVVAGGLWLRGTRRQRSSRPEGDEKDPLRGG